MAGEELNDTGSVAVLLSPKYNKHIQFINLVKSMRGHQLNSEKYKRSFIVELEHHECDLAILVRDLDGFISETGKLKER